MLKPKYLEQLPGTMIELYSQAEQDILEDMARRISTYDYWIPAADWQYQKLIEMGNFHSYVMASLSARTGKSQAELERLMDEAGAKALRFDADIYRAHGLTPPPLAESEALRAVLADGLRKTNGLFDNLTATTANTVTRQFEQALDRAWIQITSGGFDRNAAVRTAVKDLSRQGVGAVTYPSGHVDTIEVAVRRAVVTGVNQCALRLQDTLADEMGCDLVETTAHAGARPSHAVWQGRVFSRSGRTRKYPDFVKETGYGSGDGLGGWNCRHSFFPYFDGSPRAYTKKDLAALEEKNVSYNGEQLTEYEASQRQRYIERQIRRWKRENLAMEAAGQDTAESAAKIRQWQDIQKDFLKQTGFKRQRDREQVAGFGRKQAEMVRVDGNLKTSAAASDALRNTGRTVDYNPKADFSIQLDGYNEKVLRGLSKASRIVADEGGADGAEHLQLVDLDSGDLLYHENGYRSEVGGPDFWSYVKNNPNKSICFVHNHTTDGYFSETDMRTLLYTDNIKMFVAVRLDGIKYIAEKSGTPPVKPLFDMLYQSEIDSLTLQVRNGIITLGERTRLRELMLVDNLLRDYTKGLIELDGRP